MEIKKDRLTESEVHAVIEQIIAETGSVPVIEDIYGRLGKRGGFSTISKHRKTWIAQNKDKQETATSLSVVVDVPDEFSRLMNEFSKKIWYQAKSTADAQVEVERQHLKQIEQEIKQELEESSAFGESLGDKLKEIEITYADLQKQHQALNDQFIELQMQLRVSESRNADLQANLDSVASNVNELADLVTAKEKAIVGLEGEKHQLTDSLKERDAAIGDLKKEHAAAIEKLEAKHGIEIDRLEKVHDQTLAEIKAANARALDEAEKSRQRIVEQLESSINSLTKDKQVQAEQLKKLGDNLEAERSETKALRKQIDDLKKSSSAAKDGAKSGKKAVNDGEDKS
jgi:chromosome segregation ATPase